jgi:hypothetical protein
MQISNKVNGILAALFKVVQHNLNADNPARQEHLIEQFLDDPRNNVKSNTEVRSSIRGNLRKDLTANSITMKTFVKLMTYLRIYKFDIIIEIPHSNGKITQHKVSVDINTGLENEINSED